MFIEYKSYGFVIYFTDWQTNTVESCKIAEKSILIKIPNSQHCLNLSSSEIKEMLDKGVNSYENKMFLIKILKPNNQ